MIEFIQPCSVLQAAGPSCRGAQLPLSPRYHTLFGMQRTCQAGSFAPCARSFEVPSEFHTANFFRYVDQQSGRPVGAPLGGRGDRRQPVPETPVYERNETGLWPEAARADSRVLCSQNNSSSAAHSACSYGYAPDSLFTNSFTEPAEWLGQTIYSVSTTAGRCWGKPPGLSCIVQSLVCEQRTGNRFSI